MSLWDKIPISIIQEIYEYDLTYKEKLDESLNFIEHACPSCCCDGGKKTRYRHYGSDENIFDAFWNWEWRRRNACLKHNPGDFDKNGNQTEYSRSIEEMEAINEWWLGQNEIILTQPDLTDLYFNYEIRTGRVWFYGNVDHNSVVYTWVFCTRNKDIYPSPIKTYSRKKLTGSRFMDMAHNQRSVVA
jgi:hypothetical protein